MIVKRAVAFGVILIAIFFISTAVFSQPAAPDATLLVTSGEVSVQQTSLFNQTTTVTISTGESLTVSSSDTIEVADNAAAELYLFEGSVVQLSENTILELTQLTENEGGQQIYMTLFNGRIINRVTKLLGINDAYEVRTPSSTASVRGTIFSVEVIDPETSQFIVSEGIVAVTSGSEVAQVQAGEMVTAVSGQPLSVEPVNNPELLPTLVPTQDPGDETSAPSSEETIGTPDEATTNEPTGTRSPSETANPAEATSETPANTTTSPASPTNTARSTQAPNSSVTALPPTNAGGSPVPPNSSTTALPPTNTPVAPVAPSNTPVPNVPTNTPVPNIPTSTPVPNVPTNTPVPVVPTNTPVPAVPTNTPLPAPTNTPEPPPPPTEEPSQVTLCHNPGPNQQTKQVNANAVQAHLDHGDYLGACD